MTRGRGCYRTELSEAYWSSAPFSLPEKSCVEVPCLVDKNGVQPTRIGRTPPLTLALNRTFVNVVELTVHAAIEQRRDLVYQAARSTRTRRRRSQPHRSWRWSTTCSRLTAI